MVPPLCLLPPLRCPFLPLHSSSFLPPDLPSDRLRLHMHLCLVGVRCSPVRPPAIHYARHRSWSARCRAYRRVIGPKRLTSIHQSLPQRLALPLEAVVPEHNPVAAYKKWGVMYSLGGGGRGGGNEITRARGALAWLGVWLFTFWRGRGRGREYFEAGVGCQQRAGLAGPAGRRRRSGAG